MELIRAPNPFKTTNLIINIFILYFIIVLCFRSYICIILAYLLQGTGVGEIRNPSDPASYGLDPKKATLRLKFRVQNNYAPIAAAKNINKKFHNIEAEDENGNTMWEAVLWKGRLYVSVTANQLTGGSKEAFIMLLEYVSC